MCVVTQTMSLKNNKKILTSLKMITSLTSSLRRSSVNAGTLIRITSPSLEGLTPKLAALIAFSILPTDDLSYLVERIQTY
jgi:hypothetical protein